VCAGIDSVAHVGMEKTAGVGNIIKLDDDLYLGSIACHVLEHRWRTPFYLNVAANV